MKKTYILEDLDCAGCAAKIEEAVSRLDGVKKSTVAFLTQKLTVELEDNQTNRGGSLITDIRKIVQKYEPEVEVIER